MHPFITWLTRSARRMRTLIIQLTLLASLLGVQTVGAFNSGPNPQTGDGPQIEQAVLDAFSVESRNDYIIVMAEQADLSAAYEIEDWVERGQYVVDTLKAAARESQKDVRAALDAEGARYESFYAGNEIYVYGGSRSSLNAVQALGSEVAVIRAPVEASIDGSGLVTFQDVMETPVPEQVTEDSPGLVTFQSAQPQSELDSTVTWGLTDTHATTFWSTFNITGQGIIVANLDTGVQYDHPALAGSYRCPGDPDSLDCWYDPTGMCTGGVPCDNNGHGTHTMGTMVASNSSSLPYTAGMAPGATWIACKACASNNCADDALLACADWILAPNGNVANRPNIVNNSWGGSGGLNWYRSQVTNWRASGIFPAFSAGNDGEDAEGNLVCSSLGSPGDYPESFATASHNADGGVSDFSSRGPGAYGDSPYTKPNLSAPGGSILSTYPGSAWGSMSGTSMASPHTAGAVALLWSCAPELKGQIDQTFQILQNSAGDTPGELACGTPAIAGTDYAYGYGYLDVMAAGVAACAGGTISGQVTNASSGQPLGGVEVTAQVDADEYTSSSTDASGNYSLRVPAGSYTLTAALYGYTTQSVSGVTVSVNGATTQSIALDPSETTLLTGTISDGSGRGGPLPARLTFTAGEQALQVQTNAQGAYSARVLSGVAHTLEVEALYEDYLPYQASLTVSGASAQRSYILLVNPLTCAAQHYVQTGAAPQTFTALTLPANWSIEDNLGNGQVWTFENTTGFTGSSGGYAVLNSDAYKSGGQQDSSLVTPVYNFSSLPDVYLNFDTHYWYFASGGAEVAQVDLRVNNGAWTQLWKHTTASYEGPVSLNLSSAAGGQSAVQVRFHYYNGNWDYWWKVDNVSLGGPPNCAYTDNIVFLPAILN